VSFEPSFLAAFDVPDSHHSGSSGRWGSRDVARSARQKLAVVGEGNGSEKPALRGNPARFCFARGSVRKNQSESPPVSGQGEFLSIRRHGETEPMFDLATEQFLPAPKVPRC
jgi:hypothetical protein